MSRETFQYICRRLKPALEKMDTNYRVSVPLQKRVAVALWKLATNAEYRTVSHLFGVGISTACDCVKESCSSVEEILLPETIQMPNTEKLKEMALYFEHRWGLPQCVGAIDGSHIPLVAPQEYHTEYFNRKGWYSIVLQAVVDGRGLFWNVYTGQPGSLHDARVLRLSALWDLAERGQLFSQQLRSIGGQDIGHYILGDAAYPLASWLMKPFPDNGHLTQQQEVFNHKTSKARVVVENTFGRLKGRWRCLQKRNDCSLERVKSMVLTCCVLHNLCESHDEEYREEWGVPIPFSQPDLPLQPPIAETEGTGVRATLMHHLNCVADV
ncbi:protein ANTAGONIST OF LIKE HETEROCHROMATIN PROTEIN 1 [Chanos chanos]|uniref:Protein ANTAGONIST OF LIKE HETEROCHROMATIN PROTEIN 1 n=1 Tax=Chanos chanos TaxID=29144 RepID=A0A6J2UM55_CHACN|nr:protein ANTAGONIST OF LIKE HETEROCHROMATIN PROTEIN 1-like [Chanos chanos]